MADLPHELSGPASPKPDRPNSADWGKLRVFISYSRDDLPFADQLDAALNACGFESVIDRHGISGGEDWKRRLGSLISEADTVVFVLSPTSARSEICSWEAEEAERLGKRILPIIEQPLEGASPPPQLRERNYIFFYADLKAAPGAGFGTGLAKLIAALNTDFDWLREHTRYLQRATEWDKGGRPSNRLLSGDDIAEAKAWAARRPKNASEPTALHLDFIRASEDEAEARSNAQHKQFEEMAAAQAERETALRQTEEAQRKRATMARIRNIAFVAVSIFAVLAAWLFVRTELQRGSTEDILAAATNMIFHDLPQVDSDRQKEAFYMFQTGAQDGIPLAMEVLGSLYADGRGVAKDYAKAREWFQKAAEKGRPGAISSIGELYANGRGVAKDYAKARELFDKAAAKGDQFAMFRLGELYANGQGVAKDYAKAREWFEKAADGDYIVAMFPLGELYANGRGVAKDYAKAHEWFVKAADKGDPQATIMLATMHGQWARALQLQEAVAAKWEGMETADEGKPGLKTERELRKVEWCALLAREFAKASTVADRAHALFPDDLAIESNRAHTLMFLGREEDAKALYLAYKGKSMSEQDSELWEGVIAEDFAEFRKAGLTYPMMADIEKELGISP